MISHRLANLKQADQILVLDKGELVEQGNYNELMNKNCLFASMARTQNEIEQFA